MTGSDGPSARACPSAEGVHPAIPADKIEIEATTERVTIEGEHTEEEKLEKGTRVREEFRYGKIERTIVLPTEIDPDKVEATYEQGILSLVLPTADVVKPKTVKITSAK